MRIGAVTVPLATTLPENSLELITHHAGCKIIFADEQNWEKARGVAGAQGCALARGDQIRISNFEVPSVPITNSDTAIIIYTSGTTGNPKGVELTFDNLNNEIRGAIELLQMTPEHRILSVLPFSHVLPLIANGLGPLCAGAGVLASSSRWRGRRHGALDRHRRTFVVCVAQLVATVQKRIVTGDASRML